MSPVCSVVSGRLSFSAADEHVWEIRRVEKLIIFSTYCCCSYISSIIGIAMSILNHGPMPGDTRRLAIAGYADVAVGADNAG